MQRVTLLGSTGSIGQSTLDVVRQNRHRFAIHALVAGRNLSRLAQQIQEFEPAVAVVAREEDVPVLAALLKEAGVRVPDLRAGLAAYTEVTTAPETDFVMSAIVGVAGMEATYEAIRLGKRIGLANKETLVAGGSLVMAAVKQFETELIPVDSEHNGAHQCLRAGRREDATKLILTASGGPFRKTPKEELLLVKPEQALNHPTWQMGPRITVDSATLMNKGFEVIEACWLFDFPTKQVEVVVHPQSTVHAMVEYNDGSVIAQVCATDMRMPIQYALTYPERANAPVPRLDWAQARTWEFHAPDLDKFPLLRLAYEAQDTGGTATCTLNAADEVAVEAFLRNEISFPGIAEVVEETLNRVPSQPSQSIGQVLEVDRESRTVARQVTRERLGARVMASPAKY
ncbi:1-deoxy-D-xylulose-5-phosphate reductoisomerase [Paludibaculum fermentans]|uniref:1-deoxy-D-xylulose 5-phosphate reductoisomerase n=1 Tax=Paludibaculum fermentans TaxID=1473598 RepID=A0A7S7SIX5_PALFE|nr:1-deoxy-D-xylulose-5-phosphate reductoisomerase [Paludibaculum fermentans]QOY85926.1 1-deoxy-D-xylulose-5-phosphate reductoisomerase [Paludibaculum fermentans]